MPTSRATLAGRNCPAGGNRSGRKYGRRDVTNHTYDSLTYSVDDTVSGMTGLVVGTWTHALEDRMAKADAEYGVQTWDDHDPNNPYA